MDYRYLSAFIAVSRSLSFSKASKSLNISKAAVSRQIKLFEESLGLQLFIRSPQHVALTKDGEEIYKRALNFEESSSEYLGKEQTKSIRIGVITPILDSVLSDFLSANHKDSDINFDIKSGPPSQITRLLESGDIDVGLYNKNIQTDLLTSLKLIPEKPMLISKSKIKPKDIPNKRWIIVEDKDYIVNYAYKKRIPKSEKILKVNSPSAQVKLVENGVGIAIVSNLLIPKKTKLNQSKVNVFDKEFFYLVTPNSGLRRKHITEFIDDIVHFSKRY